MMSTMRPPAKPENGPALEFQRVSGFVQTHTPWLFRYLRWQGWSREDAEDLLQDAFVAVLNARAVPETDAQARRFLQETGRRLSFARRRQQRLEPLIDEPSDAEFGRLEAERDVRIDALQSCMDQLRERDQLMLRRFYGERRSRSEVAEELGIEVGGVKSLLARVKDRLRRCIDARRAEEDADE